MRSTTKKYARMNSLNDGLISLSELSNLKIEFIENEYVVTLIDDQEFEIIKGYGNSVTHAINDLHSNLF